MEKPSKFKVRYYPAYPELDVQCLTGFEFDSFKEALKKYRAVPQFANGNPVFGVVYVWLSGAKTNCIRRLKAEEPEQIRVECWEEMMQVGISLVG